MTRDPLEEFFARERGEVHELPAGEDRWQAMLAESRRPHRRGAVVWLGAAAAAAVVAASVVLGSGHGPALQSASDTTSSTTPAAARTTGPSPTVTVTRTVTPGPSASVPGKVPSAGDTTPAPKVLPVPVAFGLASMTNGGDGHLYALGSAVCSTGDCTAVVGSDDDGRTWTTRASFTNLTVRRPLGTPAGPHELVGLRFATPQVGYVFGTEVRRTTDGARTWTPMDLGGRRVLSAEVGGGTVWFVTAAECRRGTAVADRGCTGLEVWSAPVSSGTATRVESLDAPQPVESAWLSMDGADAYVSLAFADRTTQVLPRRVSGDRATITRPSRCPVSGGVWVWGTAQTRGGLVLVCQLGDAKDSYGVATSSDRGATWTSERIAPGLGPVTPSGVWVTAVDLKRFVAVTRGLPGSGVDDQPTALVASSDAGSTWATPKGVDNSLGWSWAGAGGGGSVYALAAGAGGYGLSADAGSTFETVPLRR